MSKCKEILRREVSDQIVDFRQFLCEELGYDLNYANETFLHEAESDAEDPIEGLYSDSVEIYNKLSQHIVKQ